MQKIFFLISTTILFCYNLSAQPLGDNCSNPKLANITCPTTVSFNSETTAGFTNDVSTWGATTNSGKDIVYEVTVPAGSINILVSIVSPSALLRVYSRNNNCNGAQTFVQALNSSTHNIQIPVTGSGPYYIWVDHNNAFDITYNISFGVTTATLPDTRGFWTFAGNCIFPITKPNLEITYNGVHKDLPLTFVPLFTPAIICSKVYLQNLFGNEGLKSVQFTYGPHLSGFAPTVTSMPGFYNLGTWNASSIGNTVTWTFTDAAGIGRGDFTGTPNNCLEYAFCFNMTPFSNDPIGTTVDVLLFPDGYGAASKIGCCPTGTNCGIPGTNSSTGPIGVSFNDPVLPVSLIKFDATFQNEFTLIQWATGHERQADRFELERSYDNTNYEKIETIIAKGESKELSNYFHKDYPSSNEPNIYYRLKQFDFNGDVTTSKIISLNKEQNFAFKIYPNPATKIVYIESSIPNKLIELINLLQKPILNLITSNENNQFDISTVAPGVYFLRIHFEDTVVTQKLIIE